MDPCARLLYLCLNVWGDVTSRLMHPHIRLAKESNEVAIATSWRTIFDRFCGNKKSFNPPVVIKDKKI